ncbi:MAG: hypothetical protein GQF41_1629 [Candidatus Rifleibacterium amylolyticum]|nr:MAG: hypothetical protein GQF41_1629 [Candidatus Rifleibacterium amylolyticum]
MAVLKISRKTAENWADYWSVLQNSRYQSFCEMVQKLL